MPTVIEGIDRRQIERFARRDEGRHLYELGDLDPFFWPQTRWFGQLGPDGELAALALLYSGQSLPTLLALARNDAPAMTDLLGAIAERLPDRVYAHLTPGLREPLAARFPRHDHQGRHLKMTHVDRDRLMPHPGEVRRLGPRDEDDLRALYELSYPGNWFDARMLQTGQYFGIRQAGVLVCVAGVHVYSPRYRVAALGNVTTDPRWRGRGLARRATAHLCTSLYQTVKTIGLNVKADNAAAIACYRCLGFEPTGEYDEVLLQASAPETGAAEAKTP